MSETVFKDTTQTSWMTPKNPHIKIRKRSRIPIQHPQSLIYIHTAESRAIRKHIEPAKFATPPLGRILSNLPVQSASDNYCYFDWEFSLRFHGVARGGPRAPQLVPAHKLCISQLCTPPCKVVEFSNVGVCAVFLRHLLETPTRQWIEIRGWKSAFDRCIEGTDASGPFGCSIFDCFISDVCMSVLSSIGTHKLVKKYNQ